MPQIQEEAVRFQRANFVVSNLDESYKFYCGVLGLSLTFEKVSEPDSYSYPAFQLDPRHELRFAILSTPSQPRVMALTEVSSPVLDKSSVPHRSAIVLDIADIDGVVLGASKLGLQVHREGVLKTHDGRRGREVAIVDRDGNLVVIYHIH